MEWLVKVCGLGLVLLALTDIYFTVLYPRSHKGLLSVSISRSLWQLFRQITRITPGRCDYFLSYSGPTLLVVIVIVWICLLVSGFALMIWTDLGKAIQATTGPTPTDFATALYYSGYALTTLGTGDIVPKTGSLRLLLVLEAIVGLSSLTLTLTYFQSVYNALIRRNTFALSLHYRSAGTGDAAELLIRLGSTLDFDGARQDLVEMARDLQHLLESEHTYPILHYFRFREAYYALPRMLLLAMDTATLIVSALNTEKYRSLVRSAAVAELWGGGMQLLVELSNSFLPKSDLGVKPQSELMWRQRYYQAVQQLSNAGIETATDLEAGADLYVCLRQKWGPLVAALAEYLGHNWSQIVITDSQNGNFPRIPNECFIVYNHKEH